MGKLIFNKISIYINDQRSLLSPLVSTTDWDKNFATKYIKHRNTRGSSACGKKKSYNENDSKSKKMVSFQSLQILKLQRRLKPLRVSGSLQNPQVHLLKSLSPSAIKI